MKSDPLRTPERGNLFAGAEGLHPTERTDTLVAAGGVGIERIVSHGHSSPQGFWYDQEQEEWVVLVSGKARLEFESDPGSLELNPGDWVRIPAGCRHRVDWTDPEVDTVWLAVFYDGTDRP